MVEKVRLSYLVCGDGMRYYPYPSIGDLVYCAICDTYQKVGKEINDPTFRIKCDDCRYRRNFNANVDDVKIKAETHAIGRHHLVMVRDEYDETIAEYNHRE